MRKVFLSTLVVFGFINFCFGQLNSNIERISVKTYDSEGKYDQFHLRGSDATSFDIRSYIKENEHLNRLVINGTIRSNFLSTTIKFDSKIESDRDGDYICKEVDSKLIPFLGVWGPIGRNKNGVRINKVVPTTGADYAGLTSQEQITGFNELAINEFSDLKKAVLASQIGDRVELKFDKDDEKYSKYVTIGSRGTEIITYKYCPEEQIEVSEKNDADVRRADVTLRSYPNPTSSLSYIDFTSTSEEDVIFTVTDINGRLIHKEVYTNFDGSLKINYNLDHESNGTYILSLLQGKEQYTRKLQLIKE